jgi:uncharacterized RmlC-like cupin family protein
MDERCVLVSPTDAIPGSTGVSYAAGVSAATAGSRALCLELATLPPGRRGRAHLHAEHESAAYVLEGEIVIWFGRKLEDRLVARPGDFVYVPAGLAHLPANASTTNPAIAVLARTDPHEQESAVALPELDELSHVKEAIVQ